MVLHLFNRTRSDWNFVGIHSKKKHFPCKRPTLIWFGVHFEQTALLSCFQKFKWNGLTSNKLQFERKSPFWGNSSVGGLQRFRFRKEHGKKNWKIRLNYQNLERRTLDLNKSEEQFHFIAPDAVTCYKNKQVIRVVWISVVQTSM